jgi:hypothetical protein
MFIEYSKRCYRSGGFLRLSGAHFRGDFRMAPFGAADDPAHCLAWNVGRSHDAVCEVEAFANA